MSQDNAALVRNAYDAFARGDINAVLDAFDERIKFVVAENSLYYRGSPYVGRQEVAERIFGRIATE